MKNNTKTITIGFLGGCLGSGWNTVSRSNIYHQIIRRKIKSNLNLKPKFFLDDYGNFDVIKGFYDFDLMEEEILSKVEILAKKELNCLIFQLRPFLYTNLSSLLQVRHGKFSLNPLLVNVQIELPIVSRLLQNQKDIRIPANRRLGNWFKLSKNIEKKLADMLEKINNICNKSSVKLFVLMPVFPDVIPLRNRLATKSFITENSFLKEISFVDTELVNNSLYFENDNAHVNKEGHGYLADIIYDQLESWYFTNNI